MNELDKELKRLTKGVRIKHFPKGQILLYKDDYPVDIYILKKGIVKIYDEDHGNQKILHVIKPYAILPFAFFSGGDIPIRWYYSALTECDICVLPYKDFMKQIKSNMELFSNLTRWFSIEVHELLVRLSSMGKTTARAKIIAALKFLAVHHTSKTSSGWHEISFPVNHQLLADMTGVSRERAALIMKNLTDKKVIRNPRQSQLEINLAKLID